jgi:hypothetical protein
MKKYFRVSTAPATIKLYGKFCSKYDCKFPETTQTDHQDGDCYWIHVSNQSTSGASLKYKRPGEKKAGGTTEPAEKKPDF